MIVAGQLPARLTAEQTAGVMHCQAHDIPMLVTARLLKPLGNPPANGIKFFGTTDVLELTQDRSWLSKVSNVISQHWNRRNAGRQDKAEECRRLQRGIDRPRPR